MCKNFRVFFIAALTAVTLSGCGQVGLSADKEDTEPLFTTTTTFTKREVHTTKTAMRGGEVDADDEDLEGNYTTTVSVTGSLENDFSRPEDEVDEELRATQRTEAKTFYVIPEHNGTTAAAVTVSKEQTTTTAAGTIKLGDESAKETATKKTTTAATTTAFNANALFELEDSMKYSSETAYTVTSDTTYLNLRYGPSKKYEVRLKIPDGSSVKGLGETVGKDGNVWVYTSHNGTYGWVMKDLLS